MYSTVKQDHGQQSSLTDQRYVEVVKAIVKARATAGITQAELALAIGLKQPDVSKIENNERGLNVIEFADAVLFISKHKHCPKDFRALIISTLFQEER